MLAPIALYDDALLSQVLMAASYPLEIVEAARWSQANPNLKGDAAVTAVADKTWDVSVKSLVAFPSVLKQLSDHLDWTQKLGDALIGQQADVATSIQRLRAKASAAGTLKRPARNRPSRPRLRAARPPLPFSRPIRRSCTCRPMTRTRPMGSGPIRAIPQPPIPQVPQGAP